MKTDRKLSGKYMPLQVGFYFFSLSFSLHMAMGVLVW